MRMILQQSTPSQKRQGVPSTRWPVFPSIPARTGDRTDVFETRCGQDFWWPGTRDWIGARGSGALPCQL